MEELGGGTVIEELGGKTVELIVEQYGGTVKK